jgi:hypothetical protein
MPRLIIITVRLRGRATHCKRSAAYPYHAAVAAGSEKQYKAQGKNYYTHLFHLHVKPSLFVFICFMRAFLGFLLLSGKFSVQGFPDFPLFGAAR